MLWGLLVVMTGAMLVLVEVHVRYLLFILPLLVYAWVRVLTWVNHRMSSRWGDRLFAAAIVLFIGTNGARDVDFAYEQRRGEPLAHYKRGRYASLPELAELCAPRPSRTRGSSCGTRWADPHVHQRAVRGGAQRPHAARRHVAAGLHPGPGRQPGGGRAGHADERLDGGAWRRPPRGAARRDASGQA
jgi:hypothetical protein